MSILLFFVAINRKYVESKFYCVF